MKTQDIVKTGIDRNFIRQCEKKGIIAPARKKSEWMTCEEYAQRDYSQEDVEKIWSTYLYRKIDLSFEQIKALNNDKDIPLRKSMEEEIAFLEREIEEKKVLIRFMKYIKGLGFIPLPPEKTLGSKDFKSYLQDFMQTFDTDKKIEKSLNVAEAINNVDKVENLSTEKLTELEEEVKLIFPNVDYKVIEDLGLYYSDLKECIHLEPQSVEVQLIIQKIYSANNKLNDNKLSVWDFVSYYVLMLDGESVFKDNYVKLLGAETVKFFSQALIQFLIIEEPERIKKKILKNSEGK